MILETIYLKDGGEFSKYLTEWAETKGIETVSYEFKPGEDQEPHGLLLINENQDICRDIGEVYSVFDRKHIPTAETEMKWPHLNSIAKQFPPLQDCGIGLLIDYNCAEALAPQASVTGEGNKPCAVKTALGWSIVRSSNYGK